MRIKRPSLGLRVSNLSLLVRVFIIEKYPMLCVGTCSTDIIWISLLNFIFCDLREFHFKKVKHDLCAVANQYSTVALALLIIRRFTACEVLLCKVIGTDI